MPTIALLGCTWKPVIAESRREAFMISWVTMRLWYGSRSARTFIAITTSSSEQLPARSPMPLMVHSICRAPASTARSELATARPRSLWQWTEMIARSMLATLAMISRIRSANSSG